jgi:hypothetical protein
MKEISGFMVPTDAHARKHRKPDRKTVWRALRAAQGISRASADIKSFIIIIAINISNKHWLLAVYFLIKAAIQIV